MKSNTPNSDNLVAPERARCSRHPASSRPHPTLPLPSCRATSKAQKQWQQQLACTRALWHLGQVQRVQQSHIARSTNKSRYVCVPHMRTAGNMQPPLHTPPRQGPARQPRSPRRQAARPPGRPHKNSAKASAHSLGAQPTPLRGPGRVLRVPPGGRAQPARHAASERAQRSAALRSGSRAPAP